jgi:GT2 family glycosyltransferase
MSSARVVVVTATYRRPRELAALLASLATESPELSGVVVVDNAADPASSLLAASAPVSAHVILSPSNLGCGGGVALGLREALADPAVTHVWIFDDDARATPGALRALLAGLVVARADAAVPLVTDAAGFVGWFPVPQPAWNVIREPKITPATFRARCGDAPVEWAWAPWPSLLVTRRAVEMAGLPRDDFWFQGEDLEWTLRLSAQVRGVLVPAAECRHLPPAAASNRARLKQAAMLQNNLFTATRLPHGRRARRHVPGNLMRFLVAEKFSWTAIRLAWRAHWLGGVRGLPAGAAEGDAFRRAWEWAE